MENKNNYMKFFCYINWWKLIPTNIFKKIVLSGKFYGSKIGFDKAGPPIISNGNKASWYQGSPTYPTYPLRKRTNN